MQSMEFLESSKRLFCERDDDECNVAVIFFSTVLGLRIFGDEKYLPVGRVAVGIREAALFA